MQRLGDITQLVHYYRGRGYWTDSAGLIGVRGKSTGLIIWHRWDGVGYAVVGSTIRPGPTSTYTKQGLTMKRIDIDKLTAEMLAVASTPAWAEWHDGPGSQSVILEFPAGEMWAPGMEGFIWAWKMLGVIEVGLPILDSDRFSAQGLEGKCRVHCLLVTALLAARDLPTFRRAIYRKGKA